MTPCDAQSPGLAAIRFDRHKYGPRLLADACTVDSLPSFIKTPRPHRLAFYEVALVTGGRGTIAFDGVRVEVAPYRVCFTLPGEVRSWHLDGGRLEGLLAFFELELFDDAAEDRTFVERLPIAHAAAAARSIAVDRRRFDALASIAGRMADELRVPDAHTPRMLRAHASELVVAVQRLSGASPPPRCSNRAAVLARRFAQLVDERFANGERVAAYAERLGVSARHLNQCVHERTGATASETIRRRVFLEARRRLLADATPVAAIAESLGFADAPYFIRFFKRHCGATPGEFRAAQRSPISHRRKALF